MIPAALLVVSIPAIAAIAAYALRGARTFEMLVSTGACALVIILLALPVERLVLPGAVIDVGAPLNILGREIRVRLADRAALALLFGCAIAVFGLTWRVRQGWTFSPIGLIVLALLAAGLLIRPFVFSALAFVAAVAMLAIMIQTESDEDNLAGAPLARTRGALRYLTIATLALPPLLAASYILSRAGAAADADALNRAAAFMAVAFVLLFGAFPLYTWVHPVASDAPPLTTAFIASITTGALTFLFLSVRQDFAWFNASGPALGIIYGAGVVALLFGGVLGWAQNSFGRVLACAISVDVGATLILIADGDPLGVEAVALGITSRALSIGLFGFGLALLREHASSDDFEALRGCGTRQRLALLAITCGGLSMVGLPGTLGFAARWVSLRAMAGTQDTELLVVFVFAVASVGIGLIRGLAALMDEQQPQGVIDAERPASELADSRWRRFRAMFGNERRAGIIIGLGAVAVFLFGLFPAWLAQLARAIAVGYTFYR